MEGAQGAHGSTEDLVNADWEKSHKDAVQKARAKAARVRSHGARTKNVSDLNLLKKH